MSQETGEPAGGGSIAIVGIGCRFPGARGPEAFWRLLCEGGSAISEVPRDRFDIDLHYDPRPVVPGKLNTRWGGFLPDVDRFDPYFFGISPREAVGMDPQQRLLLEVAWESLEDAGIVVERLAGSRTGVFVGMCTAEYERFFEEPSAVDVYVTAGNARSVLSGRVSYALGLEGPSVVTDTACSSSLVAVHQAYQSLVLGECALALAGGVNLVLTPFTSLGFSQAQMLSPDGRCKAFDARANGFVRSDGVGMVVLKPLAQALADRDRIYAVIRGSAVNNDGRSGGLLMTPSRAGQEAVLREAYRAAGVRPGHVQYVEAHGTGTIAGDPVEARALGAVLADGRDGPCAIGSVKSNIGHTEGAAGVAGVIKTALALERRQIPASLHVEQPNPAIPWEELSLRVQRALGPWPVAPRPALAGVSSFGISGTNAHVVLEEAPPRPEVAPDTTAEGAELLTLSAHSPEALEATARAYVDFLRDVAPGPALRDVCYTASVRRTHHDHRLALVASSREDLVEHLEAFLAGAERRGTTAGRRVKARVPRLVFVFSGHGAQWPGMGRDLLERESAFRRAIEAVDAALRREAGWSVRDELFADDSRSRLAEAGVVQAMLFAVQVALAALWRSWGVEPDAVVGHSIGEITAAHVAGMLTLEDAARIVCHRARIVDRRAAGRGGMAAVELAADAAEALVAPYGGRLTVAALNGPTTTIVSGDPGALKDLVGAASAQGVHAQIVRIDYAAHTTQMDPLVPELVEALAGLAPTPGNVPMVSTVTGALLSGSACDATYWARNLREPVQFAPVIDRLAEDHDAFLEVSAHPVLAGAIADCLRRRGRAGTVLPSLRRREDGRTTLLGSLGALYAVGRPVDWSAIHAGGGRMVRLPLYPWQRERFWADVEAGPATGSGSTGWRARGGHPLLGGRFTAAGESPTRFWEAEISLRSVPYLTDHRVQGFAVVPAAAYIEMALAAAADAFGPGAHAVEQLAYKEALFLGEDTAHTVQVAVTTRTAGEASLQIWSRPAGETGALRRWTLNTTATIRVARPEPGEPPDHEGIEAVRDRCAEHVAGDELYERLHRRGIEHGAAFQGVREVWRGGSEALGRLELTEAVAAEARRYRLHPALLDACLQVAEATLPGDHGARDTILPVRTGAIRVHGDPGTARWSHVRRLSEPTAVGLEGDIVLLDEAGGVVVELTGCVSQRLAASALGATQEDAGDCLYELSWERQPLPELDGTPPAPPGTWLVLGGRTAVSETVRAQLEARGHRCISAAPGDGYARLAPARYQIDPSQPDQVRRLVADALEPGTPACRGIVHLWSAETATPGTETLDSIETAQERGCVAVLHLVQALAESGLAERPRLWIVTRGARAVGEAPGPVAVAGAPAGALARLVSLEHPELASATVDLGVEAGPDEVASLVEELLRGGSEEEVALRGDARWVPRLVRSTSDVDRSEATAPVPPDHGFTLEVPVAGVLDGFVLRAQRRRPPGPGEVELRVGAVGLNFRDVMLAMGLLPSPETARPVLGFECVGTIVAKGPGVEGLEVGDEVIAVTTGALASHVTTAAPTVVRKPAGLSVAEAATLLSAAQTAHYALNHLARLQKGERVLIHAAAGGVGLAAVQLAQRAGAEIFATAGSHEKREFLRSLGVPHVMDSRSLEFADEVLRRTGGEGVDVVLNSLAGEFIPRSLATLRAFGRFLEIGKVDVLQNNPLGLGHLAQNVTFFVVDLIGLWRERHELAAALLHEVVSFVEDGSLRPLPHQVFPISQAADALRHMAQARHIGKVVVSVGEEDVAVAPPRPEPVALHADATYLMTGGLGGLGLTVARWMVERGARHLALMGRTGASSPEAVAAVDALRAEGVQVEVVRGDVARPEDVAVALALVEHAMPPLRGIVHAAMTIDDGILVQQTPDRFRRVMAPKVLGAWNLHTMTAGAPLDFFVLFSSIASVFGSPGQGNYVAANAFLDALAHHRRGLGLPALVLNWGLWGEVGFAARADLTRRLMQRGIRPMAPALGLRLLELGLQRDAAQLVPIAVDWPVVLGMASPPLLSHLAAEVAARSGPARPGQPRPGAVREQILAADPAERLAALESFLVDQIARVLRCAPSKVDTQQPVTALGIDSLMAVELRNRIEVPLAVALPVAALLQGPTLPQLASKLLEQLTIGTAGPVAASGSPLASEPLLARVDDLSDTEVDTVLRTLLHADGTNA